MLSRVQKVVIQRNRLQNVLLLITGSKSNVNPRLAPRQAVAAKRAGITIMGIGVGLKDDSEIRNIVRDDRKIVLVRDHLALMEVALDVASLVCQEGVE
ncbi:hypothetical protein LSAT2_008974 [Lamellibrachia satsuma]|nr:hypothetical protein LSAT2_008974 [Lamellibrachia satsuma]